MAPGTRTQLGGGVAAAPALAAFGGLAALEVEQFFQTCPTSLQAWHHTPFDVQKMRSKWKRGRRMQYRNQQGPGERGKLFISQGVQSDVVLTQPEAEIRIPGSSLRLTCKTSGFDLGGSYMYWIRQNPGQGLEWLVQYYSPSNKYYAAGIASRFTASKDTSNNIFALDMKNLKSEDTAIYYCARYHSEAKDYWGQGTMVTVTAVTPSPPTLYALLSSCEQPSADGSITYGCLAMDYSHDITSLSWKKDKVPITTGLKTYPPVLNKKGTYT
uniref:Ig heavy chain Mem5-like n=1 Tax=Pristiophorus japonicus TaxID=55135 RepID=UPI00398F3AA7